MSHALRFHSVEGLSTATNATVGAASAAIALAGGHTLAVSVGANPIFIRFGAATDTVTSSNGFRLPGGAVCRFDIPNGSTHLHHIRESADSAISLQACAGGI